MNRKIPVEEYEGIADRFLKGEPVREIALDCGISKSLVYRILKACGVDPRDYSLPGEDTELTRLIEQHASIYPEGDRRRAWVTRRFRAWAGR